MGEVLFIYGILVLIYGFYVYKSKKPYIPKVKSKNNRKYYKYVGKTTMLISCAPMISGIISSLNNSAFNFFLAIFILILGTVLTFVISNKYFK